MNTEVAEDKPGLKERFWEEMRLYGFLTVYLFISFTVLQMYETSLGGSDKLTTINFSMTLVQALVIGKFLLIGKAMGVGNRSTASQLFHRIAWRTVAFAVVLVVFKIIEELIVGWFHDESSAAVMSEFFNKGWMAIVSPVLVMILLLVPLTGFVELERAIGSERMAKLIKGET